MAKDPAMLWYWGDWFSGTALFSRFLKGCYMDVLNAQFNHGHLSLEEIKVCLGSDFGTSWPTLQKKFKIDEIGLFFNERLEVEKNKRAAYTASRRNNLPKSTDMSPDMSAHINNDMENENINRNEDLNKKEKSPKKVFVKPTQLEIENVFMARGSIIDEAIKFFNYYESNGWKVGRNPMKNWNAAISNWLTNQKNYSNGNKSTPGQITKPGTSEARTNAVYNWGPK